MNRYLKALIRLFFIGIITVFVVMMFFSRSEPVVPIPPGATDVQSSSACGSGSCAKTTSYTIIQTTNYILQFYEAREFQCEKIEAGSHRLFPYIPLPYWQCKKQIKDRRIFVGFAGATNMNIDTFLHVYAEYDEPN